MAFPTLPVDPAYPPAMGPQFGPMSPVTSPLPMVPSAGGIMSLEGNRSLEARKAAAEQANNTPLIQGLAGHVRAQWMTALDAKRQSVETRMLQSLRQRRGEYDEDILSEIRKTGGSESFMMLTSNKCRAAGSWIRDVVQGTKGDKPWGVSPTPLPTLPPQVEQSVKHTAAMEAQQFMQATGLPVGLEHIERDAALLYDRVLATAKKQAGKRAERMEAKMEDQLDEGLFQRALTEFIDDIVTFPAAVLKGPVVRKKKKLKWAPGPDGSYDATTEEKLTLEWVRVDPFMVYPAPHAADVDDGDFIERHKLSRQSLSELRGVEGYSDDAIEQVLGAYGCHGLDEWLYIDSAKALAEGKSTFTTSASANGLIDALQYWGSVQGKLLIEWGMPKESVPDEMADYPCEVWLIGSWCIKAMINPDPMGRKPYFKASYEEIPGTFWGNAIPDLCRDAQIQCNVAARAIANNMAIACLTGDTVVYREGQDRKYAAVTMLELFGKKQEHNSGLRRMKLRALNEETGEFFGNRIVDIVDNGVAEVFEITTGRGYKIKATGNHRFMRDDGEWQHVDDFDVGHLIAVNGQTVELPRVCTDCGAPTARVAVRCRSCASKARNSSWNQQQIERSRVNTTASGTTARMRYDCQSRKKTFCESCADDAALEVHHIDRCPWNNKPDNLKTLCSPCHHALHAKEDSFGDSFLHKYLSYDTIVSIEYAGQERVFDLCMTAPHHNFIANGFHSHNSGPQVAYNVDRLPAGEDLTQMYPWKTHQYTSDPFGAPVVPVSFFAPPMIANELVMIYKFFSELADEHTGVPRYMTGDAQGQGGALRTSSGMSMLMQNAGKAIKQVIANIDSSVLEPLIERLWYYNMKYGTDPALKGDVNIIARGAASLIIKETQQQRINEFLQLALTNPLVNQIVGEEAIASMLRVAAKNLDMDTDLIVPPPEVIRARVAEAQKAQQEQQQRQEQFAMAMATAPSHEKTVKLGPMGEVVDVTVVDKQQHVLNTPQGAPPVSPGVPGGNGADPAQTMTDSGQGAVDTFSPMRTH